MLDFIFEKLDFYFRTMGTYPHFAISHYKPIFDEWKEKDFVCDDINYDLVLEMFWYIRTAFRVYELDVLGGRY